MLRSQARTSASVTTTFTRSSGPVLQTSISNVTSDPASNSRESGPLSCFRMKMSMISTVDGSQSITVVPAPMPSAQTSLTKLSVTFSASQV